MYVHVRIADGCLQFHLYSHNPELGDDRTNDSRGALVDQITVTTEAVAGIHVMN
jgi:hypothetical protein